MAFLSFWGRFQLTTSTIETDLPNLTQPRTTTVSSHDRYQKPIRLDLYRLLCCLWIFKLPATTAWSTFSRCLFTWRFEILSFILNPRLFSTEIQLYFCRIFIDNNSPTRS
jgi:hypothetical protein